MRSPQRISLGMKQLGVDPRERIETLFKVGDLVSGRVTKLASFGAFVGPPNDIDGLVHISKVGEEQVDKINNVHQGRELQHRAAEGGAEAPRSAQAR